MRFARKAHVVNSAAALLFAATGLFFVGCASQAEAPPQVTNNLADLRDQVIRGKAQVQTTANAARDLVNRPQADTQSQVDRLVREIDKLDQEATGARQQYTAAQEQARTYFARWDAELATMSESMAKAGQQRRAESMASLETLKSRVNDLREEARPFIDNLHEVGRYLKLDPTASGITAARPKINNALEYEKPIMKKADAVIAQIDAMRGGK